MVFIEDCSSVKTILAWIQHNPLSFKGFLTAVLALVFKWSAVDAAQWTNVAVVVLTIYGGLMGALHASVGPALSSTDQAATIVAAIKGPPTSAAVAEVAVAEKEILK